MSAADGKPGTLIYRRRPAGDADVRAVGEGIAAQTAARDWLDDLEPAAVGRALRHFRAEQC